MSHPHHTACQGRKLSPKERALNTAGLDEAERACLTLMRRFIRAIASAQASAWIKAMEAGPELFPGPDGLATALNVVKLVQAVRENRNSVFSFSNPDCPCCAAILTEHERRVMVALAALRRGRMAEAKLQLLMLCEGNPSAAVLDQMIVLASYLPEPVGERA